MDATASNVMRSAVYEVNQYGIGKNYLDFI
jgi:hypothetical protein